MVIFHSYVSLPEGIRFLGGVVFKGGMAILMGNMMTNHLIKFARMIDHDRPRQFKGAHSHCIRACLGP